MLAARRFLFIATVGGIPAPTFDCDFTTITTLPEITSKGVSYARAGVATYIDNTGTVVYNRHNLCLQSQNLSVTWAQNQATATYPVVGETAPDGSSTVSRINENTNPGSSHFMGSANAGAANLRDYVCTASVYLKEDVSSSPARPTVVLSFGAGISSNISMAFDLRNGVTLGSPSIRPGTEYTDYGITSVGNGWYRCWLRMRCSYLAATGLLTLNIGGVNTAAGVVPTLPANGGLPTYTGAGTTAGWFVWGAQIEVANAPRGYIPTTTAQIYWPRLNSTNGLMMEISVINSLNWSESFATSGGSVMNWVYTSLITSTGLVSPNGLTNALKFTHDGSGPQGIVAASGPVGTTNTRALSFWARRVTGTGTVWYSINNGIGQIPLVGLTTSWQRYEFASTSANHQVAIGLDVAGDEVELWGIQLETSPGVTSYVSTANATVARAADQMAIVSANLGFWNNSVGSIVVEGLFFTPLTTQTGIFRAGTSGSNQNMMMSQRFSTNNQPFYRVAGVFSNSGPASSLAVPSVNVLYKTGLKYTASSFIGFLNGSAGASVAIASNFTTNTVEFFQTSVNNINPVPINSLGNGYVRRLRYWNSALSDVDMTTLTT